MVTVKNGHQITVDLGQRMIKVAGLGVAVVRAGDVVDTHFLGKHLEAGAVAVIQQMDT